MRGSGISVLMVRKDEDDNDYWVPQYEFRDRTVKAGKIASRRVPLFVS